MKQMSEKNTTRQHLLEVRNLSVSFGDKKVVDDVSFSVDKGEVFGIVGESGSGKTMTALSILQLTPPNAKVQGEIIFEGRNISDLGENEMRKIRGRKISLILQNPHTAFNPVFKVGYQVAEPLVVHYGESYRSALMKAEEIFRAVGISEPRLRLKAYPHELSGGMKQRAVISISVLSGSSLIIADEPTTALDPTVETQILKILRELVDRDRKSIIFISHDISVVGWISDKLAVMYGGWIVEIGRTRDVLRNPRHPYTKALLESMPHHEKPKPIPGSPLDIHYEGCRFAKRCPIAEEKCFRERPEYSSVEDDKAEDSGEIKRKVRCFFA